MTESGYIYKKTRKLFEFGVQKIIWVLTDAQVVLVVTADRIETFDWNRNIDLMDGTPLMSERASRKRASR